MSPQPLSQGLTLKTLRLAPSNMQTPRTLTEPGVFIIGIHRHRMHQVVHTVT